VHYILSCSEFSPDFKYIIRAILDQKSIILHQANGLHWKLPYELKMNLYWILGEHMRPKYRNQCKGQCHMSELLSIHAWLLSCDDPVLAREGGATSDVARRNDRGRAVDDRTACWLQPLPTRTDGQPYSEHLRLYPSVNEGDVTTFRSSAAVSNVIERMLKLHIDMADDKAHYC